MVRAVSLSHQVVGSKQSLRRFLRGKGLSRFIPSPDPTHVGASGTGSALLIVLPITNEVNELKKYKFDTAQAQLSMFVH